MTSKLNLFTVNDLDRKTRINLVGGIQDRTYTTGDSINDPEGNLVPGLDQHMDAYLQIQPYIISGKMFQ